MYNKRNLSVFIIESLAKGNVRHEVHDFASGASMIDVWYNTKFYVIQLEEKFAGISEINDDPDFSTIPDEIFYDNECFIKDLMSF